MVKSVGAGGLMQSMTRPIRGWFLRSFWGSIRPRNIGPGAPLVCLFYLFTIVRLILSVTMVLRGKFIDQDYLGQTGVFLLMAVVLLCVGYIAESLSP